MGAGALEGAASGRSAPAPSGGYTAPEGRRPLDVESFEDDPTAVSVPRCKVCLTDLSRRTLVLCQDCSAPHHRRCWGFNKGCGATGCDCRAFVLPPMLATEDGAPAIHFTRSPRTDDGMWGVWALVLLMMVFLVPDLRWVGLLLAAGILPLLMEVRHTLNLETETVELRRCLGPLCFWRRRGYLPFADVEELEVRTRRLPPTATHKKRALWEVWARDRQGAAYLLGEEPIRDRSRTLEKIRSAAESMDTVVSLPPSDEERGRLPPGLDESLRRLPKEK